MRVSGGRARKDGRRPMLAGSRSRELTIMGGSSTGPPRTTSPSQVSEGGAEGGGVPSRLPESNFHWASRRHFFWFLPYRGVGGRGESHAPGAGRRAARARAHSGYFSSDLRVLCAHARPRACAARTVSLRGGRLPESGTRMSAWWSSARPIPRLRRRGGAGSHRWRCPGAVVVGAGVTVGAGDTGPASVRTCPRRCTRS